MKPCVFTGCCVALVTPMTEDGSINLDSLKDLIEFVIDGGADALLVCGTSGEASTLTESERTQVIRCAVRSSAGRLPVLVGTGSNDTRHAIEQSKAAQALGADALLTVTPYYNKTSQEGLVRHFYAIAESVSLPLILYNVPSRTGMTIRPDTYLELSRHPRIVGVKEASGDLSALAAARALCQDALWFYSGNDDQIVPFLSLGGVGVISVLANIAPRLTRHICASALSGDFGQAAALQLAAKPLIDALFCDVNPIPVKYALNRLGHPVGPCRLPLVPPTPQAAARIDRQLAEAGLIAP